MSHAQEQQLRFRERDAAGLGDVLRGGTLAREALRQRQGAVVSGAGVARHADSRRAADLILDVDTLCATDFSRASLNYRLER
ncbi:hypothetical protein [Luteibacter sp. 329MFSha]|uniref:hypothetical protein n=1 Tax=Luteibacter sp. 329MFSha TaxID=1798239 RepID=UPI0008AC3575|nr:hypothetical protein [Luteibacter sp. 329MFSha]SEV84130.1 hypothetical protein SAMN04515660_0159 [Luteibacter sp. 329MFSha]